VSYLKKDDRGCFSHVSLSSSTDVPDETTEDAPEPTLDLESITRTVSAIKSWLASSPTLEAARVVFEYEVEGSNRVSAVGEEGCLTLFLQGD